jgi:hypothetical protein
MLLNTFSIIWTIPPMNPEQKNTPLNDNDASKLPPASLDTSEINLLKREISGLKDGFSFYRKASWGLILLAGGFAAKEVYTWARWQGLAGDGPVPLVHNGADIRGACLPVLMYHDTNNLERILEMPLSLVDHYRSLPRHGGDFEKYITPEEPLIRDLGRLLAARGQTPEQSAREIIDYVRRHVYYDKAEQFGQTGYVRYPAETLLGAGDCEDVAILAASLLLAADIDCVILNYTDHVAVGVAGRFTGKSFMAPWNQKEYFFAECTSDKYGPDDYRSLSATHIGEPWGDYEKRTPDLLRLK